jgi:hypothetical protein
MYQRILSPLIPLHPGIRPKAFNISKNFFNDQNAKNEKDIFKRTGDGYAVGSRVCK